MTKEESQLLELFRLLDKTEQKIIIGRISEMLCTKKRKKIDSSQNEKIKYYPVVYVFFIKT